MMRDNMRDELIGIIEREFYSFDVPQLVAVIEELLEDGGGINTVCTGIAGQARNDSSGGRIFFEVDADLSFPPNDVGYVGIDAGHINNNDRIDDAPAATIRLPVMNLLGASSPLPVTFSDHITRGRRDADIYADFLSILQNRLHALWLDAQRKHSLWSGGVAERNFEYMTGLSVGKDRANTFRLRSMAAVRPYKPEDRGCVDSGHGDVDVVGANCVRPSPCKRPTGFPEFALAGLWQLSNRTRSAQGLKELLYAVFGDVPIQIDENLGRWAAVSNARPLGGAARLGRNAFVGTRVYDRTSTFRITLGPLDFKTYKTFMPGENNHRLINEIVSVYLNEPVICEILITCKLSDFPRARLGGDRSDGGNVLGRTAVLGSGGRGTAAFKVR